MNTIRMASAFDDRLPLEAFNGEVIDCNGFNVFSPFDMADADAIIHAVNTHDELVAQRDRLLAMLEQLNAINTNPRLDVIDRLGIKEQAQRLVEEIKQEAA